MTWMCGLSLSANGAGSVQQAYDYSNAMLDPASGVALFDQYTYGHANSKTVDLLDPEKIEGLGIDDPANFFERGLFTGATPPDVSVRWSLLRDEAHAVLA